MQTAKLDSARHPGRTSRADVPGYRNSNINAQSQWGGIAPTGKAAAQAAILQYSAASGAMGLIFLIATYVLSVDKKYTPKTFMFLPIVQWLYIKSISFFVGFAYGLIMKFYWKCNDFKGRSKVKTFFAYLLLEFALDCWTVVAILVNLRRGEMDFYWFFVVICCLNIILVPCEIIKLSNIIHSEIKRKSMKASGTRDPNVESDIESKSSFGSATGPSEIPTAIASPVNAVSSKAEQFQPSAPSVTQFDNGGYGNAVSSDGVELNDASYNHPENAYTDFSLVPNPQMQPQRFEQMWTSLPVCGGFTSIIQIYPEIPALNSHLESQHFGIIASGLVGEGTRVFLYGIEDHQFTSRPGYEQASGIFLAELMLTTADSGQYVCKATYKCNKPGLVSAFEYYLMLQQIFGTLH